MQQPNRTIKKISIVLPCFNEQEAIPTIIPRTLKSLRQLQSFGRIADFELIVVDDKSTDGSARLLESFADVKVVRTSGPSRGYGKALKRGFLEASGDWIGFFDVDNSYRPEDLSLFLDEVEKGDIDFIMGQRHLTERGMSLTRGFGNLFYVVLARAFYHSYLSDICSGYRLFHRRHLENITSIPEQGLDFSIHLTLRMMTEKTPIKPIPIQYDPRIGQSKLSVLKDGWAFLKVLVKLKARSFYGVVKHSRV
jgi:glycosyltransferase involved in cell wall biosynthesis